MTLTELRVLIVGDNPLVRAGLAALIVGQTGLDVVGQVAASELPSMLSLFRADVLAWVVGWDASESLALLADLTETVPPVLLLLPDVDQASAALAAGAHGLLLQDAAADAVAAALSALASGLVVVHPEFMVDMLPLRSAEAPMPASNLTPRELEVLALLAEGLPNKQIALKLEISEHTVKFHVNAVMSKLGVQSRTEAVVRATRLGLITL